MWCLSGPRAELHCLGSGIHFGLIGSGFVLNCLDHLLHIWNAYGSWTRLHQTLRSHFPARVFFLFHDFPFSRSMFEFGSSNSIFLAKNRWRQLRNHMEMFTEIDDLMNELMKIILLIYRLLMIHGSCLVAKTWPQPRGRRRWERDRSQDQ